MGVKLRLLNSFGSDGKLEVKKVPGRRCANKSSESKQEKTHAIALTLPLNRGNPALAQAHMTDCMRSYNLRLNRMESAAELVDRIV